VYGIVRDMGQRMGISAREVRFTRRDIRAHTHWSDGQLKIHCTRLSEMEYLLVHGGGRGHHLQYELLYDGGDEGKRLSGLLDPEQLGRERDYDGRKSGVSGRKAGPSQAQVGPKSGPSQTGESPAVAGAVADLHGSGAKMHFYANGVAAVINAG
jgi:DNA primase